jgi:uncharacterized protein (DUF1778 family)
LQKSLDRANTFRILFRLKIRKFRGGAGLMKATPTHAMMSFRATVLQRDVIEQVADARGESVSKFIRDAAVARAIEIINNAKSSKKEKQQAAA